MKQAQAMQSKLADAQARLAETEVEGQAGNGLVKLVLTGSGALKSVAIDDSLLQPGEGELVGDLVLAAHADAKARLDAASAELMKQVAGPLAGMGLPASSSRFGRLGQPGDRTLIALLGKLPGLGPRSARRAALALLKRRDQLLTPLAQAMAEAGAKVKACSTCGALDTADPCAICADPARDAGLICVVEEVGALWALERGGAFRGRYHVLGGLLSALDGVGPDALRAGELVGRAAGGAVREVILALPATVDGQTTAHYLAERLAGPRRSGHQPGAGGAGGRRTGLAGRRHHRPGVEGAPAGLTFRSFPWLHRPTAQLS